MLIYLAGGMSGLSYEEYTIWRKQIRNAILYGDYDCSCKPTFFDPTSYYNFEVVSHLTEREIMEFELDKLRKSDLVVVNFNEPQSIGTAMEIAVARENRIPIIGINEEYKELHPWLIESTLRMCNNMQEAVAYICEYFLN